MKVLFILGFPNPFPGAGWTRVGFFANVWSKKGHPIEVLGAFSYKSLHKKGVEKIGKVNIFNLVFKIGLNHPLVFTLNSIISFVASTIFLTVRKPQIVVISVPTGDIGLGALIACKLTGSKCAVDYRDEWEDNMISLTNSRIGKSFYSTVKKLVANLYLKSHLVTAVTSSFVMALRRRGVTNIKLVPNGADVTTFKPSSKGKVNQGFWVFYSGGIGGYYRLDVVVKAIKELADNGLSNIKLVIAGEGEVQKVFNLARENGTLRNIEYKGAINDNTELAELIAEADVGLVPYDNTLLWKNSLPAKFFEYCACGVPTIATARDDSILAKLIEHEKIGLVSPPLHVERLAENIKKMYFDKPFRKVAGQRARNLAEAEFDRNASAKKFLSLLNNFAKS